MTSIELHNIPGFHVPTLLATAAHLRASMTRNKVAQEPTALIRNEGYMNGYLDAIQDILRAAYAEVPKTEKKTFQHYSQPETPNQNKA